ncbi:hypothetical protein C3488_38900 [Streptomyces sp. Ru72]|nr:hypothetical protein C3488_38900 [Streptomyces sp. Ru72]
MVIGSVVVALVVIVGLLTSLLLHTNGSSGDEANGSDGSASAPPTVASGHRGPDTTKTIETTRCTEPETSYVDPKKIRVPDFSFKNLESVKACFRAAGWKYEITHEDENTYGQDTVMSQSPTAGTDANPKKMPVIELTVSTGDPA